MSAGNPFRWACGVMAVAVAAAIMVAAWAEDRAPAQIEKMEPVKSQHVKEVSAILNDLKVESPRKHKNMVVFPIRWGGKQAPGDWLTLDESLAAGQLKVLEKDQASVQEVRVENMSDKTVFLMSGEVIGGGQQTRVVRKDTVVEARQKVTVPVFCVEQHRWSGGKDFGRAKVQAPASMVDSVNRGAGQGEVWRQVERTAAPAGARSATESLEEKVNSAPVQRDLKDAREGLGKFSPPDTIGIAVADARTGRVVGLELFGRRDLFEKLQVKLVEGYTLDLVVNRGEDADKGDLKDVTEKDVEAFIKRAQEGESKYEDTPGSGRGIDLVSGTLKGKGVAVSENVIHLSTQDVRPVPVPAKPIVGDEPPAPTPRPPRVAPMPYPMPAPERDR